MIQLASRLLRVAVYCGIAMFSGTVDAQFSRGDEHVAVRGEPVSGDKPVEIADEPVAIDPATVLPAAVVTKGTIAFDNAALSDVVAWVGQQASLSIVIDESALQDEGILISESVTDRLDDEPVYLLLDRLRSLNVGWTVDGKLLRITTLADLEDRHETIAYNLGEFLDQGYSATQLQEMLSNCTSDQWELVDGVGGQMVLLGDVLFVRTKATVHREISAVLAALRTPARRILVLDPPQHAALREALRKPVMADFQNVAFDEAIANLARQAEVDLRLDQGSLKSSRFRARTPISLSLADQDLQTVLKVLLAKFGLSYVIRDGAIWVVAESEAEDVHSIALFDVRDLCRDSKECEALLYAIQSQVGIAWRDRDGDGGVSVFARPGILVVRQSEADLDKLLELLENYRKALRLSKPRAGDAADSTPIVRFYRIPTATAEELVTLLPELLDSASWKSEAQPDGIGTIRLIASYPGPVEGTEIVATQKPDEATAPPRVAVEHSILMIRQLPTIHQEISSLLVRLRNGDYAPPVMNGGAGGLGGGFGGGFFSVSE